MKGWMVIGVCALAACGKSDTKQRIAGAKRANLDGLLFGLGVISETRAQDDLAEAVAEECGKACKCLAYSEVGGADKAALLRSCPKWTPLDAEQAKLVDELAWIAVDMSGQYLADQVASAGNRTDDLVEAMASIAIPMPPALGSGGVTVPETTQGETLMRAEHIVVIGADGKVRAGALPMARLTRDGAVLEPAKLADVADPIELASLTGPPPDDDEPPPPEPEEEDEEEEGGTAMAFDEGKMGKKDSDRAEGQYKMKRNDDPQLAREQAIAAARNAGILGSDAFLAAPQNRTSAVGKRWSPLDDREPVTIVFADKAAPALTLAKVLMQAPYGLLAVEAGGRLAAFPLAFNQAGHAVDHIAMAEEEKVDLVIDVSATSLVAYVTRIGEQLGEFAFQGDHVDGLIGALVSQFQSTFFVDRRDVVVRVKDDAKAVHLLAALDAAVAAGATSVSIAAWTADAEPATGPIVHLGQPTGSGDLDKAVIRRYVRRHLAQLEDCYVKELAAHPDLAGTVDTRWLIQPDGKVGMCNAKGVSDEVASCVCGAIKAIEFPKPKGGGPVNITSYPFTFSPKPG